MYNLIYQILSIGFLFFANTYLNSFLIPDSLKWENGRLREDLTSLAIAQLIVLFLEALLLTMFMFYINRWFLSKKVSTNNVKAIALKTAGIYIVITLSFIGLLIYAVFKR